MYSDTSRRTSDIFELDKHLPDLSIRDRLCLRIILNIAEVVSSICQRKPSLFFCLESVSNAAIYLLSDLLQVPLYSRMGKDSEAIIILLDVGRTTSQEFFEGAKSCIQKILQRKLFSNSADDIGLVLLGSRESANPLAEGDQYQNISLVRPLQPVDWDVMQYVTKSLQRTDCTADWVDGLVVSLDILRSTAAERKYSQLQVVLLSDLQGPFSDDQLEVIINAINDISVALCVVGPDMDVAHPRPGNEVEKALSQLIAGVDGGVFSMNEIAQQIRFFQKKAIRPIPWNANLQIGSRILIPVSGYITVREATNEPWKESYASDEKCLITKEVSYHRMDDSQTEVDKKDIVQGFKYGATLVPFSDEDRAGMTYRSGEKCLAVLGFAPSKDVPCQNFLGNGTMTFVPQGDLKEIKDTFAALVRALHELDMVAIVRKVYRKDAAPQLGCLVPRVSIDGECLVYVEVPFAEDLRQHVFPSLNNAQYAPTPEQEALVGDLIDTLNFANREEDSYDSENLLNPALQRFYQCLMHRGLNPGELLPPVDEDILEVLAPPLPPACEAIHKDMAKAFPLVEREKEKRYGNVFKNHQDDVNGEEQVVPAGEQKDQEEEVTSIRTVNPLQDFKTLLKTRTSPEAMRQLFEEMENVIIGLILDSFEKDLYEKALHCLLELRFACVASSPESYNKWLQDFRRILVAKNREDFIQEIKEMKCGPILRDENPMVNVSKEDAERFFSGVQQDGQAEAQPHESVEDMLDDI